MRKGFTLLELVIGIAISSMLMVAVLVSINQVKRTLVRVDQISTAGTSIFTLRRVLENDISGAFVPEKFANKPEPAGDAEEKKEPKEKEKHKVFVGTFQTAAGEGKKLLNFLTMVTCNPMQVYGESKPRIARVVYKLVKEAGKDSYRLVRQQSTKHLDLEAFDKEGKGSIRKFDVATGLKKLYVEYFATKKSEEPGTEKQKKETKEDKFKQFSSWDSDNIHEELGEKHHSLIPDLVEIKCEFDDGRFMVSEFSVPIVTSLCAIGSDKSDEEKAAKDKKTGANENKAVGKPNHAGANLAKRVG